MPVTICFQRVTFILAVFCGCPASSAEPSKEPEKDVLSFAQRLDELRAVNVSSKTLPRLVSDYERLIKEFPSHTDIASAMYELGLLHEGNRDAGAAPIGNSLQEGIKWLRQAVQNAKPGSWLEISASLELAACLRELRRDGALVEARSIIEGIMRRHPEQFVSKIRAKTELILQCLAKRNYATADRLCRELLQSDGKQGEGAGLSKVDNSILQNCQRKSAVALMQCMIYRRDSSEAEKEEWFSDFAHVAGNMPHLAKDIELNKRHLSTINLTLRGTTLMPATTVSSGRRLFLFFNVLLVIVFGIMVAKHRLMRRLQAAA